LPAHKNEKNSNRKKREEERLKEFILKKFIGKKCSLRTIHPNKISQIVDKSSKR
jgi:hypothetical protein